MQKESLFTTKIELPAQLQGKVLTSEDAAYQEERLAWNRCVDQYPTFIVLAQSAADVAAAVVFARENQLDVAVQSTGHGNIRPADNCLLIRTSGMNGVAIDAKAQTAWVEAGVTWGTVLARAQAVGLAPLLGSAPHVGAIGYTLGGGMGWLARKYGLSADNVKRFELVTAVGELIQVSATEYPDLFWGLRGGGGTLGIVTGMEIQLYPVTTVYGGNLYYPAPMAKAVFAHYRRWLESAPDELTSSVALMNFPPIPEMPDFLRGQSFVIVRGCYCGSIADGERLLAHWREWQAPLLDDFKAMPFSEVATISNDPVDPMPGLSSGAWLHNLTDEAVETLIRYIFVKDGPPPFILAEVRHAGGAMSRVQAQANAYGNRQAQHLLQVVGVTPTPEAHSALRQTIARMKRELQGALTGGVYMNFLEGVESQQRVRDGLTDQGYERMASLKAAYDPDNRFSYAFQIPPQS